MSLCRHTTAHLRVCASLLGAAASGTLVAPQSAGTRPANPRPPSNSDRNISTGTGEEQLESAWTRLTGKHPQAVLDPARALRSPPLSLVRLPACRMSELFLPAQPGSFSLLQALVQGLVPSTWDSALFDSLGAKGRWALYQSSTGCRDWVLVGPQTATVTLTAYEGIQDAVWERQVAGAEHRLALRGPRRGNTLVLRQPSPNQAALHSLLCITPAAGRAVSELAVLQLQSSEPGWEGVFTPWLRALPWAFPNLTTLRIDRLCGRMPPPAMLPGLRQLHVKPVHIYFDDHPKRPDTIANMFASIARYTPQLHSLHVGHPHKDARLSWHGVFDRVSTTLQRVSVAGDLCREGIQLLCQYAPALQYLSVESFHVDTDTEAGETAAGQPAASEQVAGLTWQVCDVTVGKGGSVRLDMLPCTTAAGLVIRRTKGRRVECFLDLADTEVSAARDIPHTYLQQTCSMPVSLWFVTCLPAWHP